MTACRVAALVIVVAFVPVSLSLQAMPWVQASPPLPDVQSLGPQVGDRVPDFTLVDQNGRSRTLTSLMGPKGLMLVFFRSADW
jgi:cytochrome oxidase Cu insertion factor (SCO1/SenC/PrrC family)